MFARRVLPACLAVCAVALAGPIRVRPDASLGFRYEPGVETKLLLNGGAELEFGHRARLFGGLSLAAIDNPGFAHYGLEASATTLDAVGLKLQAQVNHDEWSSWRAGENRVAGMIGAEPLRGLELGIGLAWRAPVFDSTHYRSPFIWAGDAPEWNWIYRLDWTFLARKDATLAAWLANIDRLTIHNPQQFPFGLRGSIRTGNDWRLNAQLGTCIKGLSSLLFSLGELNLQVGVCREL